MIEFILKYVTPAKILGTTYKITLLWTQLFAENVLVVTTTEAVQALILNVSIA